MNRRAFLASLAAAIALDPERALWVPGRKLISIAAPRVAHLGHWPMITVEWNDDYSSFKLRHRALCPRCRDARDECAVLKIR